MAGAALKVEIDDRAVLAALAERVRRAGDVTPALRDVGEALLNSTRARFDSETDPTGQRWPQNADATLLAYLRRRGGLSRRRTASGGRTLTQKGARALGAKKVLRDSGNLADTLRYAVSGATLTLGTDRPYGATQHSGGKKSQFPHPWGDIPPRPFLGPSADDARTVLDILADHLAAPR